MTLIKFLLSVASVQHYHACLSETFESQQFSSVCTRGNIHFASTVTFAKPWKSHAIAGKEIMAFDLCNKKWRSFVFLFMYTKEDGAVLMIYI